MRSPTPTSVCHAVSQRLLEVEATGCRAISLDDLRRRDRDERLDVGDPDPRAPTARSRSAMPISDHSPGAERSAASAVHRPAPWWSRCRSRVSAAKNVGSSSMSGVRGCGRSMRSTPTTRPGARRQHDDPIRQVDRLGQRVGDEQHRRVERLAQPRQQVSHVGPGDLVERRERLVHQEVRSAERERPGEGDALLHAARQLVRVGVAEVGEPDLVQAARLDVGQVAAGWPPRLTSCSRRTLASTVRHGSSAGDCGTNPIRLRVAGAPAVSPSIVTVPCGRLLEPGDRCAAASSCRSRSGRAR